MRAPSGHALLLDFLAFVPLSFFDALAKCFLTLTEGFRKLRQPGGAKQQEDHKHDEYCFRGTESRDREHCLSHNFLFPKGAEPDGVRLVSSV